MKKILIPCLALAIGFLFAMEKAEAIGRGGGGGGRGGGGGGGGGGRVGGGSVGARAPASLPARSPSISTRPATPISRPPSRPTTLPAGPKITQPKISQPKAIQPKFDSRPDFKLPGNFDRPATLPKVDRPPVVSKPIARPGLKEVSGKIPDFKGKTPDFKGKLPQTKDRFPDIAGKYPDFKDKTTRPKLPDVKDRLPDLAKKNPGLFDRPAQLPAGIPGAGRLPGGGPSRDDIGKWLDMPHGGPGGGPIYGRVDNKQVNQRFVNNWQSAVKNSGNKFINVDLSKNVNYQNLVTHRGVVNNNFRPISNNWFNDRWWDHHHTRPWPWYHYHWTPRPAIGWWRPMTWAACGTWLAGTNLGPPVYYDYGNTVVVQNDVVYVDEEVVAAAPVYAQQAIELAEVTPPPKEEKLEWLPLGTWALMSREDDDSPDKILQLALSKDGIISGALFTRASDKATDVEGKVDPATQRIAIHDPKQPDIVLEVGLYNLTKEATPCLIHFGTRQTQTWYLVRLESPEGKE